MFQTKHWDYRVLHPIQATLEFAESYKRALKMAIRKRHDYYAGTNYSGLSKPCLLDCSSRDITGMHKARQAADEHGIPYDFWCYRAMQYAMEIKMINLPRPNMMYSKNPRGFEKISMVDYILRAWAEANQTQLFASRHPYFTVEQYCSSRAQMEHQQYLIHKMRASRAKPAMIAKYVLEDKLVFPELVVKEFGEAMMRQAKKYT